LLEYNFYKWRRKEIYLRWKVHKRAKKKAVTHTMNTNLKFYRLKERNQSPNTWPTSQASSISGAKNMRTLLMMSTFQGPLSGQVMPMQVRSSSRSSLNHSFKRICWNIKENRKRNNKSFMNLNWRSSMLWTIIKYLRC